MIDHDCKNLVLLLDNSVSCFTKKGGFKKGGFGKCSYYDCREARGCDDFEVKISYHIKQAKENKLLFRRLEIVSNYGANIKDKFLLEDSLTKVFKSEVNEFIDLEKKFNPLYQFYFTAWVVNLQTQWVGVGSSNIVLDCPECFFIVSNNFERKLVVRGSFGRVRELMRIASELSSECLYEMVSILRDILDTELTAILNKELSKQCKGVNKIE